MKFEKMSVIKDLEIALKDFEPMVKDPKWLWSGRKLQNFNLLPREVWGNWLVAVVLRKLFGHDVTFADTDNDQVDGYIVDITKKGIFPTEHVSALDIPNGKKWSKGEQRVIEAINLKINRGCDYAQGKILVAFFDGAGEFFRNKIREAIHGKHNFEAVFCVGLINSGKDGYSYVVTEFRDSFKGQSITHMVKINGDFTDWSVVKMVQ